MNSVNLVGNLGTDPETVNYETDDGPAVIAKLFLAVDRDSRDADEPDWIPVTTFGGTAKAVIGNLGKGDRVAVTGSLHSSSWQTDDGTTRSRLEVNARRVTFL